MTDLTRQVSKILKEKGIPVHLSGYLYLRDAIELIVKDPTIIYFRKITTRLYPSIALKYNVSSKVVAKSIDRAIHVSNDLSASTFMAKIVDEILLAEE